MCSNLDRWNARAGRIVLVLALVGGRWANGDVAAFAQHKKPPLNVVVVMADDMGWRDTGYSGNPIVKTPHLDDMAAQGVRFDYFYPGQQMCSPGRFALLTGRAPFRTGLHALGAMRAQEITLAQVLRQQGYQCGMFGKWHLGNAATSPTNMGFHKAVWSPNYFDLDATFTVDQGIKSLTTKGESSIAIMEVALEFIREQVKEAQPFFTYICFGSPHSPHRAAPEFKALYKDLPEKQQNFWGEISGLDAAMGNLRGELKKLGVADHTLVWFCSDNGGITKESMDPAGKGKFSIGVRTVSVLECPVLVPKPLVARLPCSHMDMYPTIVELTGARMPAHQPVVDGESIAALLRGDMAERKKGIGFMLWTAQRGSSNLADADFVKDTRGVWIEGSYKLIVEAETDPKTNPERPLRLYDIYADPAERNNLAAQHPELAQRMRTALDAFRRSVRDSYDGKDFKK